MKKYILILAVLGAIGTGVYLFYPEKASEEQIDGMATEICQAIDGIDINNVEELIEAVMKVGDITGKPEYQKVTEEEQDVRAKKVCPEKWIKFSEAYEKFDTNTSEENLPENEPEENKKENETEKVVAKDSTESADVETKESPEKTN